MPRLDLVKKTQVIRSPRVIQLEGMFGLPAEKTSRQQWEVDLPIENEDWNVGLIVGPSGCGKTSIARECFKNVMVRDFSWFQQKSIVDSFPEDMGIKEITALLSSVGFSSPPSWLRPFHVLSNGEQFRVSMARALAESQGFVVIDKFTSVVDRTVARIGSYAVARAVRQREQKFVAISCHYDIIEWLDPDWIYMPATNEFQWRSERQSRPPVTLEIINVHRDAWQLFRKHHYLDSTIHKAANCFVAFVSGHPAAFTAVIHFPHRHSPSFREHRTVCLPDYQGIGIGNALSEFVASLYSCRKKYTSVTGHPAMIRHRAKSKNWRMTRKPSAVSRQNGLENKGKRRIASSHERVTAGFVYCGPRHEKEAREFGLI